MNSKPAFKVGIIGAGNIAQTAHIPGYLNYGQPVMVEALCSRSPERMQDAADKFAIPHTFHSIDEMLSRCRLYAVSVCTPNAQHYEAVMKALDAGCHVFCEKPPAFTARQAAAMADKAKEKGRVLAYNLPQRQMPEIKVLKALVDAGELGKVYHIKASFLRRRGIPGWGSFTNKEIQGGGALIDIGIHILDLALHLCGYPALKNALASTYDHLGKKGGKGDLGSWDGNTFTVEDACFAHLNFHGGISLTLETSFALNTEPIRTFNLELFATTAGATLSPFHVFTVDEGELTYKKIELRESGVDLQHQSVHRFLDACQGTVVNLCTAAEGAALQEIIEEIYSRS
ncbi:MAG: Gfo/Idh/MocA family oxidoreductase [Williamsia sp.]|nr:Gfo/Idh/MocA family oxidoreductase [Williamsia sp.]